MARKLTTFTERLEAAKDVVALYNHAQEVRAVLDLLLEFAFDGSGMRVGLYDAARQLFQEIFLQGKPETAEDHGAIFDMTDINWSERLNAVRSVADPVASAHERLLKLIAALEVETIAPGYEDLVFHLREEAVQFVNPTTVDQVRDFPAPLRGLGLVHLLDQYKARPGTSPVRIREAEGWITTFLDRDAEEIAAIMADANIHTASDVLDWGRKRK
jgi:hypothetical protein